MTNSEILQIDTNIIICALGKKYGNDFMEQFKTALKVEVESYKKKAVAGSGSFVFDVKKLLGANWDMWDKGSAFEKILTYTEKYQQGILPNIEPPKLEGGKYVFTENHYHDVYPNMVSHWEWPLLNDMKLLQFWQWLYNEVHEGNIQSDFKGKQKGLPVLKWNTAINQLYTLFFDFLDKGIITYEGKTVDGAKAEIARMLAGYFVDKEGERLSFGSITQALKPNEPKAKKRINISNIAPNGQLQKPLSKKHKK